MNSYEKIILPDKYYLDYFKYLLNFVSNKYNTLLSDLESSFISEFELLTEDAQCLYVRLSNRKGRFFRFDKLNYPEIENLTSASRELSQKSFLIHEPILAIEEEYQLVSVYNKSEIVKKLKKEYPEIDYKQPKSELILEIIETLPSASIRKLFYEEGSILTQAKIEELAMIKLFFFGHTHGDMSDFVIRDIGNAKFIEIDESKLGQSFDTREEALAVMTLSQYAVDFQVLAESSTPEQIKTWFYKIDIQYFLDLDKAQRKMDQLIHKVGYYFEKQKHYDEALIIYQHSEASPMRERQIRIFNKQKDWESALSLAKKIIQKPNDDKEYYLAQDIINKDNQKLKSTTVRQRQGLVIKVPHRHKNQVEQGVLDVLYEQGYDGVHGENSIWTSIFGLVFWDEIFDPKYNTLHQPLQRNPTDVYGKDFFSKRKEAIESRLSTLRTKKQIRTRLTNTFDAHHGVANMFLNWDSSFFEACLKLIDFLSPKQIKATLLTIALDPKTRSSGFPDLLVWNESTYHFYEVKSPTDHLSEKQLFWLEFFKDIKINAEVILVEWKG